MEIVKIFQENVCQGLHSANIKLKMMPCPEYKQIEYLSRSRKIENSFVQDKEQKVKFTFYFALQASANIIKSWKICKKQKLRSFLFCDSLFLNISYFYELLPMNPKEEVVFQTLMVKPWKWCQLFPALACKDWWHWSSESASAAVAVLYNILFSIDTQLFPTSDCHRESLMSLIYDCE